MKLKNKSKTKSKIIVIFVIFGIFGIFGVFGVFWGIWRKFDYIFVNFDSKMTDHHEPKPKQKYYKLSDFDDHVKDYFKKKCSTNLFEPIGIHHIGQGANAVLLVRKNPTGHKDWCRYIEGMQYGPSVDKLNLEKDFTLTRNDFVFITDDLFGQIIYKNQTY